MLRKSRPELSRSDTRYSSPDQKQRSETMPSRMASRGCSAPPIYQISGADREDVVVADKGLVRVRVIHSARYREGLRGRFHQDAFHLIGSKPRTFSSRIAAAPLTMGAAMLVPLSLK